MLSQWLGVMVSYAEPVDVRHGMQCWTSGCESSCVMLNQWLWVMVCNARQWLWIMVSFTVPVVVNHGVLYWVSGFELCCAMLVNNSGLYSASGCEFAMLCQLLWVMVSYIVPRLWIMVCNAQPVVVNHGVLCCGSGCESWWVIMTRWVLIMVCYCEAVMVNHGVLCWTNGYVSWCAILSQWLWIMVCYPESVVVNLGLSFWASDFESWWTMLSQ